MSNPLNCCTSCETPETVDVPGPEGADGAPGADGTDGQNAYTVTTADFDVPIAGANVTVSVVNSGWMVDGQVVVVDGPAHFEVISKPTAQSAILEFLDYDGDVAAGTTIPTGDGISPSGVQPTLPALPDSITAFGAGTAYVLTTTPAAIDLGTTDPAIVLTTAGDWLLYATVRVDFNGATFAAVQTVTLTLRRTNNTAADVTNGSASFVVPIVTTVNHTAGYVTIGPIPYSTVNIDDALTIYASVSVLPGAGSIDVVAANIAAVYVKA